MTMNTILDSAMPPAERIARLKELLAIIPPGKWAVINDHIGLSGLFDCRGNLIAEMPAVPRSLESEMKAAFTFIAACRTDVPWLIEQLERTQALLDLTNMHVEELAKKLHAAEMREREAPP